MKIRRFIYVLPKKGGVVHIKHGSTRSEGITACGKAVLKGWYWFRARSAGEDAHIRKCKSCLKAA